MSSKAGSIATGTSGRRPSRSAQRLARAREARVQREIERDVRELRSQRGGGDPARGIERHRHARVAVEQAEAVVDRAGVADERIWHRPDRSGGNVDLRT